MNKFHEISECLDLSIIAKQLVILAIQKETIDSDEVKTEFFQRISMIKEVPSPFPEELFNNPFSLSTNFCENKIVF
jgi:hypothetical protein